MTWSVERQAKDLEGIGASLYISVDLFSPLDVSGFLSGFALFAQMRPYIRCCYSAMEEAVRWCSQMVSSALKCRNYRGARVLVMQCCVRASVRRL